MGGARGLQGAIQWLWGKRGLSESAHAPYCQTVQVHTQYYHWHTFFEQLKKIKNCISSKLFDEEFVNWNSKMMFEDLEIF